MEWIMRERVDLARPQGLHTWPDALMVPGDSNAHRWVVTVYEDGKPVSLEGWSVYGYITRCRDDVLVPISGTASGCEASVTFAAACYVGRGELYGVMQAVKGDVRLTLACGRWRLSREHGASIADPEEVLPSLPELLAEIENMRTATQEATDATAAANAAIDAANTALDKTAADAQAAIAQAIRDTDAAVTEIREVSTQAAPPIVAEADGALVTIGDGGARPVVQLVSSIAAVQAGSGEPSPENVRAITGWDSITVHRTGENLVSLTDYTTTNGHAATVITEDVIDVVTPSGYDYGRIPMSIKGGVTYTLVIDWEVYGRDESATGETLASFRLDELESDQSTLKASANQALRYVRVYRPEADADTFLQWNPNYGSAVPAASRSRVMLLVGEYTADTAPAFVPGKCTALTAALPEMVYGGSLDWVTGVLTVTHEKITITGEGASLIFISERNNRCRVPLSQKQATNYTSNDAICDRFPYTESVYSDVSDDYGFVTSGLYIFFRFGSTSDVNTQEKAIAYFKANPTTVVYKLTEPYTVQIDPQVLETLRGSNVIWSDCGDTAVSYVADTKLYIDNKFTALQNAILAQGANI